MKYDSHSMMIDTMKKEDFVFIPGKEEVLSGRLRIRYNGCKNEYYVGAQETFTTQQKTFSDGWDSVLYACQELHRVIDSTKEQVYLERVRADQNARISWKFDFTTTGLVLDRLHMKMSYDEDGGGQVAVCVSGDGGMKWEPYLLAGEYVTMKSLAGSSTLMITANLIGENKNHVTRLMTQRLDESETPFDLQIRLKRPDFTVGRSLIFIGLMFSKDTNEKRLKRKKHGQTQGSLDGILHIHIQNAKRLPCRKNGTYAEPRVKCILNDSEHNTCAMKTRALSKTLNPIWNEFLTIPDMSIEKLHQSTLEIQVVHSKRTIGRAREILGHVKMQQYHVLNCNLNQESTTDYDDEAIDNHTNWMLDVKGVGSAIDHTVSVASIERKTTMTQESEQSTTEHPSGGTPHTADIQINHEEIDSTEPVVLQPELENITFRNSYYRDVLQESGESKQDCDESFEIIKSFEEETKQKSLEVSSKNGAKRRAKSVDNGLIYSGNNYTLRILKTEADNTQENNIRMTSDQQGSASLSDRLRSTSLSAEVLGANKKSKPLRKKTFPSKLFRSGSVSNILENSFFEEKVNRLSHKHWNIMLANPTQWFYCWHPLQGVDNLLKNS